MSLYQVEFELAHFLFKKTGRGALVALAAEPRARARRILLVAGGSCHDNAAHPPLTTDNILSSVLKFDLHKR